MARILLSEDDEAVRELVTRALGEEGHELTATPTVQPRLLPSTAVTANSICC